LVELLRQPQYSPYPVAEQVISVWGGTTGKFDNVPVSDVLRYEREFLDYLRHNTKVLDTIAETGQFTADTEQIVLEAMEGFKAQFVSGDGKPLATGDPVSAPIADEDLDHEQIVVKKIPTKKRG
jgi:F-type H+-transporting ATPase subunit alpha